MDDEAASRGTTVYLVDKRIDMLPSLLGTSMNSTFDDALMFQLLIPSLYVRSLFPSLKCGKTCILLRLGKLNSGYFPSSSPY
jgi:hypothetical protein